MWLVKYFPLFIKKKKNYQMLFIVQDRIIILVKCIFDDKTTLVLDTSGYLKRTSLSGHLENDKMLSKICTSVGPMPMKLFFKFNFLLLTIKYFKM